ncbi:MAG: hypothetical protein M1399_04375 [Actinobacteria bacterium]|nr:hypothetical protein [Actinomycetota bacterium]MCL5447487.1 hypothetical protein [Actinomycetota bacterium]
MYAFTATKITQRRLQIVLGLIWLLDGALQFQPYMFTKSFVKQILIASAQGNPGWVADPTTSIAHFLEPHIVAWNAIFATLQVAIGAGIIAGSLTGRVQLLKVVLAGSFAWSLLVWWLSEGLGGVLSGASPLVGAPGAVVLYLIIGLLLWPGNTGVPWRLLAKSGRSDEGSLQASPGEPAAGTEDASRAGTGTQPGASMPESLQGQARSGLISDRGARTIWAILWVFNGFLLLEPSNQMPQAVSSAVTASAAGQPGWFHSLLVSAASIFHNTGSWVDSLLAVVMLLVGMGVAFRLHPRLMIAVSVVISLFVWIFGEGLGGILTGQGTDPNSGVLLVLLAGCLWVRTVSPAGRHGTAETALARCTVRTGMYDEVHAGTYEGVASSL